MVFLNSINWSTGILMLILCVSKKANINLLKKFVNAKVDEFDSRRTVSTQVSREERFQLNSTSESPTTGLSSQEYPGGVKVPAWGYEEHNGPAMWTEWFPVSSSGSHQSPVDMEESSCIRNTLPPLQCEYGAGIMLGMAGRG